MTSAQESEERPFGVWWPSAAVVRRVHKRVMEREGRTPEHCRESALESALARGLMRLRYEGWADAISAGAWLCVDLAQSHSFADGNKRTAFATLALFLDQNDWALRQRGRVDVAAQLVRTIEQFHVSQEEGRSAVSELEALIRTSTERKRK